jgi:transcriptional regulator with XRE-family HTH domain
MIGFLAVGMIQKNLKSNIGCYLINQIRELRIQKELSQEDIALHLNLSTGFIGHLESPNFRAKYNTTHLIELVIY